MLGSLNPRYDHLMSHVRGIVPCLSTTTGASSRTQALVIQHSYFHSPLLPFVSRSYWFDTPENLLTLFTVTFPL